MGKGELEGERGVGFAKEGEVADQGFDLALGGLGLIGEA